MAALDLDTVIRDEVFAPELSGRAQTLTVVDCELGFSPDGGVGSGG